MLCPDASVFVPGMSGSSCVRRHTSAWQSAASAATGVGWGVVGGEFGRMGCVGGMDGSV